MKIYKAVTTQYTEHFETFHSVYFESLENAKKYVENIVESVEKLSGTKVSVTFKNEGKTHFLRFNVKKGGFPQTSISMKALKRIVESDSAAEIPFAIVEIEVH